MKAFVCACVTMFRLPDVEIEAFAPPLSVAHFYVVRCYALSDIHIRGFAKASNKHLLYKGK